MKRWMSAKEAYELLMKQALHEKLGLGFKLWIASEDGLFYVPQEPFSYVAGVEVHE